jgi:hypothetical protein
MKRLRTVRNLPYSSDARPKGNPRCLSLSAPLVAQDIKMAAHLSPSAKSCLESALPAPSLSCAYISESDVTQSVSTTFVLQSLLSIGRDVRLQMRPAKHAFGRKFGLRTDEESSHTLKPGSR